MVACRYLYHSSSNPEAAFQSAKILRRIANYPNIQNRLVGDFTHDQVCQSQVLCSGASGYKNCSSKQHENVTKQKYCALFKMLLLSQT